ncbi:hypothetical protein SAZ11_04705 [Streptomyces sp. FXJ1.4098]|nr:hypothetical protein [Streptomyces sp. FXJ1.4098]
MAGAAILHITGITPALGAAPALAVRRAVDIASAAGVPISLDINFRSLLWDETRAGDALRPLLRRADLVFAGSYEARLMVPGTPTVASPSSSPRASVPSGPPAP